MCKFCTQNNNHKTADQNCPEQIKQKSIKKIMTIKKLSYNEAKNFENNNENNFKIPNNIILKTTERNQNISYADVVKEKNFRDEIKKRDILLNILKQKFNEVLKEKPAHADPILIEIGKLFETYLTKNKENENITEPKNNNGEVKNNAA